MINFDFYEYVKTQGIKNLLTSKWTRARRSFYEIGYDMFLALTKPNNGLYDISYMRDLDEFVPCRSADRQCAMFCKNFGGNCNEKNL